MFDREQHLVPLPNSGSKLAGAKDYQNKNREYKRRFDRCGAFVPAAGRIFSARQKASHHYCVRTVVAALTVDGKAKLAQENIGLKLCDAVTETETKTR